jgi:uncharacterized membrane protein
VAGTEADCAEAVFLGAFLAAAGFASPVLALAFSGAFFSGAAVVFVCGVSSFFFVTISGALLTQFLASLAGTPSRFGKRNQRLLLKKLGFGGVLPGIRIKDSRNLGDFLREGKSTGLSIAHHGLYPPAWCHNQRMNYPTRRSTSMALYLLVSGIGAWLAAFTLSREGYQLALNGTNPSCDINPFFSCGSVMQSPQATLFFDTPNQLFGVAGYVAVAMVGAAMLAGATFKRPFWILVVLGVFAAYFWLMWMFVQAVFFIGFLCLYCMVVWAIHIPLWWILLPWVLKQGILSSSPTLKKLGARWLPYSWILIVINYAVIGIAILIQFPLLFAL